jgi:hypothetical protein
MDRGETGRLGDRRQNGRSGLPHGARNAPVQQNLTIKPALERLHPYPRP